MFKYYYSYQEFTSPMICIGKIYKNIGFTHVFNLRKYNNFTMSVSMKSDQIQIPGNIFKYLIYVTN